MSDQLIEELRKQIDDLRKENGKRRTENKGLKTAKAKLETDLATANQKQSELAANVGKAPSEFQDRINELTSENRALKHKSVFREKAINAGVDPKAIDTLWRESGYKADTDEVNADAMDQTITASKESHPFLFRAAPVDPAPSDPALNPKIPGATPPPPPRPPVGADRGGSPGSVGSFRVSETQLADPAWMMKNQAAYRAAGVAGTLVITA